MNTSREILFDRLVSLVGIEPSYVDVFGERHQASTEAKIAILTALGFDVSSVQQIKAAVTDLEEEPWRRLIAPVVIKTEEEAGIEIDIFLPADEAGRLWRWQVACEQGEQTEGMFRPADLSLRGLREIDGRRMEWRSLRILGPLPIGYHRLLISRNSAVNADLVIAPRQCYRPRELLAADDRGWGISAQLYTLRSARNWGIGDFTDLGRLCALAGCAGALLVATNPLHALSPYRPADASPYAPSSRLFLNPIYIDVAAVPGFAECLSAHPSSSVLSSLRSAKLVDYPQVLAEKMKALEALFAGKVALVGAPESRAEEAAFKKFVAKGGAALRHFAAFSLLGETLGRTGGEPVPWRRWPSAYRSPQSSAVAHVAAVQSNCLRFFEYLQYLADRQLAGAAEQGKEAGLATGLVRDLALGIDPDGADAWMQQDAFAMELRCGAPPDGFHPHGQEWGVVPLNPLTLHRDYSSFIAPLRASMRYAGGLRIDHVIGLQRQYLVPVGVQPNHGCYVRYPLNELLAILALESCRHRCLVIGEDLGTVPEGFRDRLRAAGAFGCAVLYFERTADGRFKSPKDYHRQVVASAATHDLPTLVGYWMGRDIATRQEAGIYTEAEARQGQAQRRADRAALLEALAAAGLDMPLPTAASPAAMQRFVEAVHAFLASSSAQLFVAQLDDLLGEPEQINIPGTASGYPNWRRKLSVAVEDSKLAEALELLARINTRYRHPHRQTD